MGKRTEHRGSPSGCEEVRYLLPGVQGAFLRFAELAFQVLGLVAPVDTLILKMDEGLGLFGTTGLEPAICRE